MKRVVVILALLSATGPALAEGADATTRHEISYLLGYLGSSSCRFNRNGTWHGAGRAVAHLNRKYEYLLRKDLVRTAEEFIQRAASQSSTSGKPYTVKCGNGPEVPSGEWFGDALRRYREGAPRSRVRQ